MRSLDASAWFGFELEAAYSENTDSTLEVMSRNGAATRAPFWMMRIRPPCSRTNRRPVPSLGTSIPVGDARSLTNADRASAGGPPGGGLTTVLEEPPPQPNSMTRSAGATRLRENTKPPRKVASRLLPAAASTYCRNCLFLGFDSFVLKCQLAECRTPSHLLTNSATVALTISKLLSPRVRTPACDAARDFEQPPGLMSGAEVLPQ